MAGRQANDTRFVARRNGCSPEGCLGRPSIAVWVTANTAGFQTATEPIPPAVGFLGFGSSAGRRRLARPRLNIGKPGSAWVAEAVKGGSLAAVASVRASWPNAGDRSPAQGRSNAIPCGPTRSIWQCRSCLFPEHHNAGPPDTPSTGYRQDARRNAHGQVETARRNGCRGNTRLSGRQNIGTTLRWKPHPSGIENYRRLSDLSAIGVHQLPTFLEQNRGVARQTPV
jgi:hypothetical protein